MSMRAVVYVPPGRQSSRHRDACTRRAAADGLEIVEVATSAEAARDALDSGRADVVLAALHEHALEVRPELIVAAIPRQRGPAGLLVAGGAGLTAAVAWLRGRPIVAAALAGGAAAALALPFVIDGGEPPAGAPPPVAQPPAATAPATPRSPLPPATDSPAPPAATTPPAPELAPTPVASARPPESPLDDPLPDSPSASPTGEPTSSPPDEPSPEPPVQPSPPAEPEPDEESYALLCARLRLLGIRLDLCI